MAPAPVTTSTRPTYLSNNSSQRRREIPAQTRTSSTLAGSSAGAWGSTVVAPEVIPNLNRTKSRPSLSFALSPTDSAFPHSSATTTPGHPLKCDWEVYFSHRSANQNNANSNKNKKSGNAANANGVTEEGGLSVAEKEKGIQDEWSTSVVKLGGFSSVRSSFLHLIPATNPYERRSSLCTLSSRISPLRPLSPLRSHPQRTSSQTSTYSDAQSNPSGKIRRTSTAVASSSDCARASPIAFGRKSSGRWLARGLARKGTM